MNFRRIATALAAVLMLALAAVPRALAQVATGAVEGVARNAQDGTPLTFMLVHVMPTTARPGAAQRVLTDAEGRFRAEGVPAGEYRLQVEQIGFERTLSPALKVEAGATARQEIRSAMVPIQLEGLTVRAGGGCLTGDQLSQDPALATVWNEARKGVETRRAFDLQYRFMATVRQEGTARYRLKGPSPILRVDTIRSEPDSVLVRETRRRAVLAANGYGSQRRGLALRLPNEKELMDEEFLRAHCLETGIDRGEGTLALRFRPVQRQNGMSIRGALWVDAATYQIRRLEVEHLQGERSLAQTSVDYRDIPVGDGRMRLPASGKVEGRPSGVVSAIITAVAATLTYTYQGFERVRAR
jgi:hypothetical protein